MGHTHFKTSLEKLSSWSGVGHKPLCGPWAVYAPMNKGAVSADGFLLPEGLLTASLLGEHRAGLPGRGPTQHCTPAWGPAAGTRLAPATTEQGEGLPAFLSSPQECLCGFDLARSENSWGGGLNCREGTDKANCNETGLGRGRGREEFTKQTEWGKERERMCSEGPESDTASAVFWEGGSQCRSPSLGKGRV